MFCQAQLAVNTPPKPESQQHVLKLTAPALDTVRVAFVGLGMRGPGAVERWSQIEGTDIVALCDIEESRVDSTQKILERHGRHQAAAYFGDVEAYKEMCKRDDIDIVYICTDWVHHVPIALFAMEHGKHVAIEVPAATTMEDIWALVNASERTRKHCMMLENCVYDFFEMACLQMAQRGLFGEVLHVEGSYLHNLEDFWTQYWNNWRLDFNRNNRGDVYPTHGFGPDCQLLNIHRGDRLDYLVAVDTKAANGPHQVYKQTGKVDLDFANGDQTSTLIRTEAGKTILLQHDVMTPRPYSRMYQVVGTDGYASKYPRKELLFRPEKIKGDLMPDEPSEEVAEGAEVAEVAEGEEATAEGQPEQPKPDIEKLNVHECLSDSLRDVILQKYTPQWVKDIEEKAKAVGGHGGMDYLMDYRLVYCLRHGLPLDMDVYDMAEWCCVGPLSRISIERGSQPVLIPDFTRGAWHEVIGFKYEF